ncbi:DUF2207 domain-containing protein [Actinomadura macrotermitis]|uniref:DUF2207 domain-containing protein n=1 Tax=Actinomadura macrotermitis TaxID=2585200 RepID=UPI0018868377|nr:DUF2207 domain-containing protein [Actinomadura macrotermitis]
MRTRLRGPLIALCCLLAVAASAPPAPAERIPTYDVLLDLRPDGTVHVRETITYDFDTAGEHGIERRVRYRIGRRLYGVHDVRAGSSTGAPARARTLTLPHDVQITVGDRDRTVHGRQAYVIEYVVTGAFTPAPRSAVLTWDALGTGWDVAIGEAAVRVVAPVPLRHAGCRAGRPPLTVRCRRDRDGPYAIDFTQRGLRPHEGMTVKVVLPEGAVRVPPPRYAAPYWTGGWAGLAALACALLALVPLSRRPAPGRAAGPVLLGGGLALIVWDVSDDIVRHGLWGFSAGDTALTGLALVVAGAGALWAYRCDGPFRATVTGRGD